LLLVGDAEQEEEAVLTGTVQPATLLQVGHHGSATSTSDAFLKKVNPKYAVVSAGKPNEGMNKGYCHPRQVTIDRLDSTLGGTKTGKIEAFDETGKCSKIVPQPDHWHKVSTSDHLWFTERDGDVVLTTKGDGTFQKAKSSH
jgi:competence protein ComEC